MNRKAVALLSGGLDSALAICLVKEQGVEIEAVYFQTMFGCCKDDARKMAYQLGVPLTHIRVEDDYLKVVENPKYGYGRGMNPCVDCRAYMFERSKRFMEQVGASFLISGEVLDQRPMSQKMRDFRTIEAETGLTGKILRPLSAHHLPETEPEKAGIVDRSQFFGVVGRSRKQLLKLAERFRIEDPPMPSAGCALTSPAFGKKVKDVFEHHPDYERWQFELLKIGRHFRVSPSAKVIVARNQTQNETLELRHPGGTSLMTCANFGGPHALIIGEDSEEIRRATGRLMLRYAQKPFPEVCEFNVKKNEQTEIFRLDQDETALDPERFRIT